MAGSPPQPPQPSTPAAAPAPGTPSPEERVAARREKERARHAAARAAGKRERKTAAERRAATAARTGTPAPDVRRGHPRKITLAQVAEALAKTGGLMGVSAQLLKVERRTVELYVQRYASLQRVREQAREQALDHTEWALIKAAKGGEPWAVQWFLKYQGKHRGYQEVRKTEQDATVRVEVAYTDDALGAGRPTTTVTQVSQLPPPPPEGSPASADAADSSEGSAESSHYEQRVEVVEAEVSYPAEDAGGGG